MHQRSPLEDSSMLSLSTSSNKLSSFRDRYKTLKNVGEKNSNAIKEGSADGNLLVDQALDLVKKAGLNLSKERRDKLISSLGQSQFHEVYGEKPIIIGTEHCQAFRDKVLPEDRFVAPLGAFNSGTNLVFQSLEKNCAIKEKQAKYGKRSRGMRDQPSWGKHSPSTYRGKNKASSGGKAPYEAFFPIVIAKDPFTWMSSLCRHWYEAHWLRFHDHCPNLVPINGVERTRNKHKPTFEVNLAYKLNSVTYSSMVDLWNTWYNDYVLEVDFPRLIIRFEDMLFHSEEIVTQICECVGGELEPTYTYTTDSAKDAGLGHRGASDLITSVMKYANTDNRFKDFTEKDKEYAMKTLRPDLMELLHY